MSEPKESLKCAGRPEVTETCFRSPPKKGSGLSGFHVAGGKRDVEGRRKAAERLRCLQFQAVSTSEICSSQKKAF